MENRELTEEITKLESDRKLMESAKNTQLIKDKHQSETSVMQVQAENNQLKTENNRLKTENNQLRDQIAAENVQLESHHKEEKLHLESRHQREKRILQSEVERLTKELEHITTVSTKTKLLVSILHFCKLCFLIFHQEY